MRQVFLNKGAIALKEVCEPILNDHSVLISVYHSLIIPETEKPIIAESEKESFFKDIPDKIKQIFSSMSTKNIDGAKEIITKNFYGEIKSLGHSCSGKVIATGSKVTKFRIGDFVACAGNGYANHADIISVPENFIVQINNKSLMQEASFIAIGSLAYENIRKAQLQIGEIVCVVGLDLLGQLTAQIAKLSGCKVIAIDTNEFRLKKAREQGINITLNPKTENLALEIENLTNHNGVDCTIITEHIDRILQQSINFAKKQGRIVLSQYKKTFNVNYSQMYNKEINIINIPSTLQDELILSQKQYFQSEPYGYKPSETSKSLEAFMALLENGLISTRPYIGHIINIDETAEAYKKINKKETLGVLLNFLPKPEKPIFKKAPSTQKFIPATKDSLHIGIVGAGSFTKNKLMPVLSKIKQGSIEATADKNITRALNVSNIYGATKTVINEHELFDDSNINVVFINSPHRMHSDQAIEALKKGKAVFLEKPMATDLQQLDSLYSYLQNNKDAQFCVDYNRSLAPFIKKIKSAVTSRVSPLMLSYRMNTGFLPKDQWLQRQMGAGRLIGEACHIFEMFLYLVDAQPIAVSVESLKPTSNHLFPTDNFTAQISFTDGSICTLLYTSIGHVGTGKERMEVFYDSKTIIMDDYVSLEGYGLPLSFNETVKRPNTGQEALINKFLRAVKQPEYTPPITIDRLAQATEITLIIDQLALKGGGEKIL